jgi:glutamate:GABA antiporter
LLLSQINATVIGAYQFLVSMSVILYFIPFLYMYAAVIRLVYRPDRDAGGQAVLVPGGKAGVWIAGSLAFLITLGSMVLAAIPPGGENKVLFEAKLVGCTAAFIGTGLVLYWRGAMKKKRAAALSEVSPGTASNS